MKKITMRDVNEVVVSSLFTSGPTASPERAAFMLCESFLKHNYTFSKPVLKLASKYKGGL